MAMNDPGEVILTLEMIAKSRYSEYRHTVLAGRVAAIVGVQILADLAARDDKAVLTQQAGRSLASLVRLLRCLFCRTP